MTTFNLSLTTSTSGAAGTWGSTYAALWPTPSVSTWGTYSPASTANIKDGDTVTITVGMPSGADYVQFFVSSGNTIGAPTSATGWSGNPVTGNAGFTGSSATLTYTGSATQRWYLLCRSGGISGTVVGRGTIRINAVTGSLNASSYSISYGQALAFTPSISGLDWYDTGANDYYPYVSVWSGTSVLSSAFSGQPSATQIVSMNYSDWGSGQTTGGCLLTPGTYTLRLNLYMYGSSGAAYQTNQYYGQNHTLDTATLTVTYVQPDTSITVTPSTTSLTASDTSDVTVNVTGDTSPTQYRLYTNNIPRWVSTYTGGGSSSTDFTIYYSDPSDSVNELPPAGSTYNYFVEARVPTSSGGDGIWVGTGDNFNISRTAAATFGGTINLGSDVVSANPNQVYTSSDYTVSGITPSGGSVSISISGSGTGNNAQYKINSGSYTSSPSTVVNGDVVTVQVTSSASASTTTSGTLTIDTSTDIFSVTTASGSSGGGTGGGVTGGDYGLIVYSTQGSAYELLNQTTRTTNVISTGSFSGLTSGSTTGSFSAQGMTSSNTDKIAVILVSSTLLVGGNLTVNRYTNYFTVTNNSSTTVSMNYTVIRYG